MTCRNFAGGVCCFERLGRRLFSLEGKARPIWRQVTGSPRLDETQEGAGMRMLESLRTRSSSGPSCWIRSEQIPPPRWGSLWITKRILKLMDNLTIPSRWLPSRWRTISKVRREGPIKSFLWWCDSWKDAILVNNWGFRIHLFYCCAVKNLEDGNK